jgi:hypothetical protein
MTIHRFLLLWLLGFYALPLLRAQYTVSTSCATAFENISATGTPLNLLDDDEANISLPFAFNFYGTNYTSLRIGNNGGCIFGNAGDIWAGNFTLPDASIGGSQAAIFPFWDDLDDDQGNVFWEVRGAAPNRRLIVQWNNRDMFGSACGTCGVTFQAVLYEADFRITFVYQDVDAGDPVFNLGASATIGIQQSGSAAQQVSFSNTAVLSSTSCITFVNNCPSAGSPSLSSTSVCSGGSIQLSVPLTCNAASTFTPFGLQRITGNTLSFFDWSPLPGRPFADGSCCSANNPPYSVATFSVNTTGSYTITSDWTGGFDGYLFLYAAPFNLASNPPTTFLAANDDNGGNVLQSRIVINLTAGQVYYLVHTGFGSADFGNYTTTFSGPGLAGTLSTAGSITVNWTIDGQAQTPVNQPCGNVSLPVTVRHSDCNIRRSVISYTILCNSNGDTVSTGSQEVFVFPDFQPSFLTETPGSCTAAPSLASDCAAYNINGSGSIPTSGTAGLRNFRIGYRDGPSGVACWAYNYSIPYSCDCPVIDTWALAGGTEFCSTGNLTVNLSTTCPAAFAPFPSNRFYRYTGTRSSWAPLTGRPFFDGTCCSTENPSYDVVEFAVDVAGSYTIYTDWSDFDGYLLLYTDPLNLAANPPTTFVAGNDDFSSTANSQLIANLVPGRKYYLVLTSFSAGTRGFATTTITGPGQIGLLLQASPVRVDFYLDGILQAGAAQPCGPNLSFSTAATYTGDGCNPQNRQLIAHTVCTSSGQILRRDTSNITIYPPFNNNLLNIQPGVCGQAASLSSACGRLVLQPPPTPTVPRAGQTGNDTWQVRYQTGPGGTSCYNQNISLPYHCPCQLSVTGAYPSACNPANNQYSLDVLIFVNGAAPEGIQVLVDGVVRLTIPAQAAGFVGPLSRSIAGLNADGNSHTVSIRYGTTTSCTGGAGVVYTAPSPCGNCAPANAGTLQP